MDSENASPARGATDPTAIAHVGTYVIDLTALTHSDLENANAG